MRVWMKSYFFVFLSICTVWSQPRKLLLEFCRHTWTSLVWLVVLIRLRGAHCFCLLDLKLFLPSFLCIVIFFLVCLLFLQCLFLQVPDSLLDSFFLLKFTLKSFQLLFLCLLSVQIWLGLQSLFQFFWIYASLNGFACFDVIIGEAWNLKFFGLISQTVNVHVVNISDCKFRT